MPDTSPKTNRLGFHNLENLIIAKESIDEQESFNILWRSRLNP
jgi:hypothetical protein